MSTHDLFLVPDVPTESEILEGVEGLAWEHATLYASLQDIELGSEEFVQLHKQFMDSYRVCGEHLGFLQHTSMRLLQTLLFSNLVALVISKDETEDDVSEHLAYLAHIITSCVMWMHAAYPTQWVSNLKWEHLDEEYRGIDFPVTIPTGGEKDDDDR